MKAKHFCDKCIIYCTIENVMSVCLNNGFEYFGEAHEGLY